MNKKTREIAENKNKLEIDEKKLVKSLEINENSSKKILLSNSFLFSRSLTIEQELRSPPGF